MTKSTSDKNAVREAILKKRNSLSEKSIFLLSERICANFFSIPEVKNAKCIGIYISYNAEVGTEKMILDLLLQKKKVFVPVMDFEKGKFDFAELDSSEKTLKNKIGIPEPATKKIVNPKEIDLFVVPGIAFDLAGHRIGSGKGYYDRFFAANKIKATKIALAFDFQIVEKIPAQSHDVKMDYLVTETSITEF